MTSQENNYYDPVYKSSLNVQFVRAKYTSELILTPPIVRVSAQKFSKAREDPNYNFENYLFKLFCKIIFLFVILDC